MSIAVIGGAAVSMYIFSIPVIESGREFSSAVMLRQFHYLITLGAKYLQNGSRIQGISLSTLVYLLYRHPDPDMASRWKWFAAALFVGAQVAWYEVVYVFPTNDRLVEMEGELRKTDEPDADRKARPEVMRLLEKWRRRHIGRIIIPFAAVTLAFCGLLRS
ncbi:hypothetical protein W97_01047 [Coniosporium apollinis CBS 100218]|uniref:DUF1772 domain-containing protein n=1 Tax=Coniosporium apollinis (strain CBS 100218) TaxID=1168221 RepID=R7YJ45_CONA1|nr:uncharacterized protein W97_01047 [Coniosporium apollinis CBS 100218]EON61829.1 hypothetical protein W97_01047 [Coniosporium apollinis CBS 100218]